MSNYERRNDSTGKSVGTMVHKNNDSEYSDFRKVLKLRTNTIRVKCQSHTDLSNNTIAKTNKL